MDRYGFACLLEHVLFENEELLHGRHGSVVFQTLDQHRLACTMLLDVLVLQVLLLLLHLEQYHHHFETLELCPPLVWLFDSVQTPKCLHLSIKIDVVWQKSLYGNKL